MLSIGYLLETLRGYIIRMQIKAANRPIDGIEFAVSGQNWRASTLLICEGEQLPAILAENNIGEGSTVLVAGNCESVPLPNESALNIVVTTLSQMALHQMLVGPLRDTERWSTMLLESMLARDDLQSVLARSAGLIGADVLVFAPDSRLLGSSVAEETGSPIGRESLRLGRLDSVLMERMIEKPFYGLRNEGGFCRYISEDGQYSYHLHDITGCGKAPSLLLIATRNGGAHADVHSLSELTGRCIKRIFKSAKAGECNNNAQLHALFCKILDGAVSTPEVKRQLGLLPCPVHKFCSIGIVEFENPLSSAVPYSHVMNRLAEVFPECNMLVYDSAIIIIISFEERSMRISFDGAKLNTLLEQHRAYMGISNATRNRAMFRTLYLLAKSTVRLAKVLRTNLSERVFLHEDYSMYSIIDLCAQSFQETHRHNDLIYLIHPSIVEILRYDHKYNNNLLDVLYYYLLNDRNLIKTAKAMFMHRNTIINKVGKLTEIIGCDLENGELQQRLMFSCQFMRYFEVYLEEKVMLN